MNKNLTRITLIAAALALSSCANQTPKPHDWAHDVQTAETREAHLLLAKHYDEVSELMRADAEEERRMLAEYLAKPYIYGKRLPDLKARTEAVIRDFEDAAKQSKAMADYHRQLAGEARK